MIFTGDKSWLSNGNLIRPYGYNWNSRIKYNFIDAFIPPLHTYPYGAELQNKYNRYNNSSDFFNYVGGTNYFNIVKSGNMSFLQNILASTVGLAGSFANPLSFNGTIDPLYFIVGFYANPTYKTSAQLIMWLQYSGTGSSYTISLTNDDKLNFDFAVNGTHTYLKTNTGVSGLGEHLFAICEIHDYNLNPSLGNTYLKITMSDGNVYYSDLAHAQTAMNLTYTPLMETYNSVHTGNNQPWYGDLYFINFLMGLNLFAKPSPRFLINLAKKQYKNFGITL